MKSCVTFAVILVASCLPLALGVEVKEKELPEPIGWGYVRDGPVEIQKKPSERKPGLARLARGTLVSMFKTKSKAGTTWTRVRVVDVATLTPQTGWVDSGKIEVLPADQFPSDAYLLKRLGGAYLEDFTASHTEVARFVVRHGDENLLLCFLGSPILPQARLQVFRRAQGKYVPGPFLEFAFSEMQSGITSLEVRDLVGDENECVITHEPFNAGPENRGTRMMIRRIEGDTLKTLWEAPLAYRNLASFPPRLQVLEPRVNNIGSPGTVTTATVDFRPRGRVSEPVWKGKIDFYAVGREEPTESVSVEKGCPWNGSQFTRLR